MAAVGPDDKVPWPCAAGPTVPDINPKWWKTPRMDMNSSLAFLRRELAAMQLQDRGLHKQLLALNSAIRDLKTNLNESWDSDERIETNSLTGDSYSTQTPTDVAESEVLSATTSESLNAQVSHSKQDSGILTDEDSCEDDDVFESEDSSGRLPRTRSYSVSSVCLSSDYSTKLDINQNVRTVSSNFRSYNISMPRARSHTVSEGQFHRVTSMPVINEYPASRSTTNSKVSGKAFAIYGYLNRPQCVGYEEPPRTQSHLGFRPLARYGSMPVISSIDRTTVQHVRSETVPFHNRFRNSFATRSRSPDFPDSKTMTKKSTKPPLYRIWRSSSQVSLV